MKSWTFMRAWKGPPEAELAQPAGVRKCLHKKGAFEVGSWCQSPFPLASSGKFLTFSWPQYPPLYNGDNNSSCLFVLLRCLVYIKHLESRVGTIAIIFVEVFPAFWSTVKRREWISKPFMYVCAVCVHIYLLVQVQKKKYSLSRIDDHCWARFTI